MMPDFNNLESLYHYLNVQIQDSLRLVAEQVEDILKEYVMQNWYNRPDFNPSNRYTRTYEYINSITVDKVSIDANGNYYVTLYFDTNKIRPYPSDGAGRWSRHESITDGEDVSEHIPLWIEEGNNPNGGHPIYEYPGAHPVRDTKEYLQSTNYHVNKIIEILKEKGINATFE